MTVISTAAQRSGELALSEVEGNLQLLLTCRALPGTYDYRAHPTRSDREKQTDCYSDDRIMILDHTSYLTGPDLMVRPK